MLEQPTKSPVTSLVVGLLRAYKVIISPWLPPACRFEPTCSAYAELAIRRFGLREGGWLALKRLLRCQPFGSAGYDPVPERSEKLL